MKKSTSFNTNSTIDLKPAGSGSMSLRNSSYGIGSEIEIDDFDPALELKRLRQELIERLLIIQRKAALNAQSDNQKQLTVTIIPKPSQPNVTARQNINSPNKIKIEPVDNKNKSNITSTAKINVTPHSIDVLDDPQYSAERIMANIESARVCISKLQVPNLSQPHLTLKQTASKLSSQQSYIQNNRPQEDLAPQSQLNLTPSVNIAPPLNDQFAAPQPPQPPQNIINDAYNCNENSAAVAAAAAVQNFVMPPLLQQQYQQQPHALKPEYADDSFGIVLLQKMNFCLSFIGIVGIIFGVFYLLNGGADNFQPGVPVLFVGLALIVAGVTGHLLQEYVNGARVKN
ncbi:MAG: hypothetical protein LBP59_12580 [Planctomycetaceae bacterium]|jgi:hypothetical protein|nr:hypothetical protein [Planctomycetaceae bacterium]